MEEECARIIINIIFDIVIIMTSISSPSVSSQSRFLHLCLLQTTPQQQRRQSRRRRRRQSRRQSLPFAVVSDDATSPGEEEGGGRGEEKDEEETEKSVRGNDAAKTQYFFFFFVFFKDVFLRQKVGGRVQVTESPRRGRCFETIRRRTKETRILVFFDNDNDDVRGTLAWQRRSHTFV